MPNAEKRRTDHRDERDRKADHLGRRPGLHIAVGSRIQHRDTARRGDQHQQDQPPADAAQLVDEAEFVRELRGQTCHGSAPLSPRLVLTRGFPAVSSIATPFSPGTRRAGSRRCTSSKTSRQIGAATAEPPPPLVPPCSTTVAQTYRGAPTGAKATNSAWSRCFQGICLILRMPCVRS